MKLIPYIILSSSLLHALPQGGQIECGAVSFDFSEKSLHLRCGSESSIVNWGSFSITQDEQVLFCMPSESSSILNRVIGAEISSILGSIQSNGQVILVNPHGIVFGKSARIDVGGLIASTLDIASDLFQERRLAFQNQSKGKIVIDGTLLAARDAVFIGSDIEHLGNVHAKNSISIAAVSEFSLDREGSGIESSLILPDHPFHAEIHGVIFSPEVAILGRQISIESGALIDASGPNCGGNISIGGGFKGDAISHGNADTVSIAQGASILANGVNAGSGGRVVVWSEKGTLFSGRIEARGGESFGDGGSAEISSRGRLGFYGGADLSARRGRLGELLLDPMDIIVATGGGSAYVDVDMFLANPGTTQTIDPVTLDAVAASITLQATNDITFTDPVSLTTPMAALTAQAGNNIYLDASISTTGGDINLWAGPFSLAPSPVATGSIGPSGAPGSIVGNLDTLLGGATTGSVTVRGFDLDMNVGIVPINVDSGDVTITAVRNCSFQGSPTFIATNTGKVDISAGEDILLNGAILASGSYSGTQISVIADADHDHVGDFTYFSVSGSSHALSTNDGDIFIGAENVSIEGPNPGNALNGSAVLTTAAGGNILVQAFNDFSMIGYGGVGNSLNVISGSGLTVVQAGNDLMFLGGTAGGFSGPVINCTGDVEFYAGSNIVIQPGSAGVFPSPSFNAPNLSFFAGRDITIFTGPTAAGGASLDASSLLKMYAARSISMSNNTLASPVLNASGGSIDIRAGEDVTLSSSLASIGPNFINISADASIPVLWTAQPGAFLVGTPLASAASVTPDLSGGFSVFTAPLSTGISFTTVDGFIHLSSADSFFNSLPCSLHIGDIANPNELTLTSVSGDITVDPFFDIFITNAVTTGGNVFMMAQNNIEMSATGQIVAGGSVELVTDNQAPVSPLIGPGAFIMDPVAFINYGSTLRIFTAIRSQNSVLGTFNGSPFSPGALFVDSPTEQWCTYYPFPSLGSPHTIFYKDCLNGVVQQANLITTEMLFDLNPVDGFGPYQFNEHTLFVIFYGDSYNLPNEPYWLSRHRLHLLNKPSKTRISTNRSFREGL